ncbi:hypothetical protein ANN_09274 [Periplaneta americana]|uniref:Uncharacterized protein n=1 Tax=Periplaneta americana TaxID=6978 RepID=A0ABQ8TPG2_PERAM|nr:hypothetical protein ANN_09274 [Periplaneta americana]
MHGQGWESSVPDLVNITPAVLIDRFLVYYVAGYDVNHSSKFIACTLCVQSLRQKSNVSKHCAALTQIKDYGSGRNVSFLTHPSQAVYDVLLQTEMKIKEKISSASVMTKEIRRELQARKSAKSSRKLSKQGDRANTLEELRQRITIAAALVTPQMPQNNWREVEYHLYVCRATQGAHIELHSAFSETRIKRHNIIRSMIADALRPKNPDVHKEVHCIADGGSNRRNTQRAEIIDPAIRFEISATQPSEVKEEKKKIYEPSI